MLVNNLFLSLVDAVCLIFDLEAVLSGLLATLDNLVLVAREQPSEAEHGVPVDGREADGEVADAHKVIFLVFDSPSLPGMLLDILGFLVEGAPQSQASRHFLSVVGASQPHTERESAFAIQELVNVLCELGFSLQAAELFLGDFLLGLYFVHWH